MARDPNELTEECREFLDSWGYLTPAQGAFPSVAQQIIPVIQLGGRSGTGASALQPWLDLAVAQFFLNFTTTSPVAAEFSKQQIINPAGSDVVVYVTRIMNWGNTLAQIVSQPTALATEITTAVSKNLSANPPKATLFQDTEVALDTFPGLMRAVSGAAAPGQTTLFQQPFRLDEGDGLLIQHPTANATLPVGFEWSEVPA